MEEGAVDDVGDGLETTVRVPVGATRLVGGVVDLTHLIHVDERVEISGGDSPEGATYGEALSLVTLGGRGDRLDGALGHPEGAGIDDSGEGEGVGGDCGHERS